MSEGPCGDHLSIPLQWPRLKYLSISYFSRYHDKTPKSDHARKVHLGSWIEEQCHTHPDISRDRPDWGPQRMKKGQTHVQES